ncbi:MAG: glutamate--tRNA ligase [Saprospiraceae bacterium]|nr:glutamate--tRNA ligase [Saprospiraceae bacterium]
MNNFNERPVRVRFAPSPTGALHIGGIRTALYNYLLAKKTNGTFILRIEDTDQLRYVEGAEKYIIDSLAWCGILPTEGPHCGGAYGPYRQSERKDMYYDYAMKLLNDGNAYYAFDTPEELEQMREQLKANHEHNAQYGIHTRTNMRNSLTLSKEEVTALLESGMPYTVRLKVPSDEWIYIDDLVRGRVEVHSNELDDKVILKSDGMPTYHLANVVDDYLMKISHVIRGEEWLPSAAHHVLLYRFFGWEDVMPMFAHLPLILKPNGQGKLSKRDGAKFGFPVFPISWDAENAEDSFVGFREAGFLPEALINFLALLGWHSGDDKEIFSKDEMSESFSLERITKSGARFDYEKAKWFNHHYIMSATDEHLAELVLPLLQEKGHSPNEAYLKRFCHLMKERVTLLPEFWEKGYYFFTEITSFDDENIKKRWNKDKQPYVDTVISFIENNFIASEKEMETAFKEHLNEKNIKAGEILPILRLSLAGTMQGPGVFDMIVTFGKEFSINRIKKSVEYFNTILN